MAGGSSDVLSATVPRGVDPCNGMWRDRVSPASSGAQTRRVKTAVVGWATADARL